MSATQEIRFTGPATTIRRELGLDVERVAETLEEIGRRNGRVSKADMVAIDKHLHEVFMAQLAEAVQALEEQKAEREAQRRMEAHPRFQSPRESARQANTVVRKNYWAGVFARMFAYDRHVGSWVAVAA